MGNKSTFQKLIDEFNHNLPGIGSYVNTDNKSFLWYNTRYGRGGCQRLHFEIIDGGCVAAELPLIYEPGVIYVEMHFEPLGWTGKKSERIQFFASRMKRLEGPYRYIPEWDSNGVGFSLRYICGNEHLGGIPYSESSDLKMVRDVLGKHMSEFILRLEPEIKRVEKDFENKEKNMEKVEELKGLLCNVGQLVLTGAPGTGKTYLARQIARSMVLNEMEKKLPQSEIDKLIEERTSFVQFHPSYDYTDFVEGLRPIRVGEDSSNIGFERKDGIFKVLCRRAVGSTEVGRVDDFDKAWPKLIAMLNDKERITVPLISGRGDFPVSLNEYGNGLASRTYDETGRDWIRGQSKFFTKEQLYNVYMGKTGVPSGGHDNYRKAIVEYMYKNCQLKHFHEGTSVMVTEPQRYVMIIDEINRGDISKIFGELFYAVDKGYRGKAGSVKTQYQNLVEENDPFFDGFYVPENVYIIGTMNDIDRNVESMDFAIRRRFAWEEIKPEERFDAMMTGLKDYSGTAVPEEIIQQAKERMARLNSAIRDKEYGLGPAYQIGPSYFMKIADYTGDASARFEALWTHHLKPLLMEYLRGMPNADDTIDKKLKSAYDHGAVGNTESVQAGAELAE